MLKKENCSSPTQNTFVRVHTPHCPATTTVLYFRVALAATRNKLNHIKLTATIQRLKLFRSFVDPLHVLLTHAVNPRRFITQIYFHSISTKSHFKLLFAVAIAIAVQFTHILSFNSQTFDGDGG
eukprot:GHVS01101096.1.p1 GENE.GHVS01101096.1~~GHVS01101096.1.p1  ORF type:complete len:124 (-),score=9.37 GHVS01101096.1:6-377(-)